jgi:hypothetical protein
MLLGLHWHDTRPAADARDAYASSPFTVRVGALSTATGRDAAPPATAPGARASLCVSLRVCG